VSPVLFLLLSLWMATYAIVTRPAESLAGIVTLAVGLALYWVRRRPAAMRSDSHV